jgi:hypothetical protein
MRIKINLASLKQTRWYEYLERFLLGGAITVATGLIARHFGPIVGGLFLAFPAIFPSGARLIDKQQRDRKRRAGILHTIRGRLAAALDARSAAMGSIALAAFGVLIWQYLPTHNAAVIFTAAGAAWLILAVSLWRLRMGAG